MFIVSQLSRSLRGYWTSWTSENSWSFRLRIALTELRDRFLRRMVVSRSTEMQVSVEANGGGSFIRVFEHQRLCIATWDD